jgi:hypothetical protein
MFCPSHGKDLGCVDFFSHIRDSRWKFGSLLNVPPGVGTLEQSRCLKLSEKVGGAPRLKARGHVEPLTTRVLATW